MCLKKLNVCTSQFYKEIVPGHERLNFEPAWRLKVKLKQLNAKITGDVTAEDLTTHREVDRSIIDGLLHEETFFFKKSFFEHI